jgi:formylglycine-generating enzyme required for sulfatase activity/class 3 adenylate cyclase
MVEHRFQRRLAAILTADMVGYSRLTALDEAETLTRLRDIRSDVLNPRIAEFGGRLVKEMGDGLLVEFASVVDAVECAVALQRSMVDREALVPEDTRIRYRVGINLGDIVIEGDDILGDGVNVAARLQTLAEPDGITISGAVYDQIHNKLDLAYQDLGEQTVKNIKEPVRVYRVLPFVGSGASDLAQAERKYRDSVKDRFAEEASYYVPLSATTTDGATAQRARAPRSARRAASRARVEYHEWVAVGENIKQVKLDDLREAVERYACIILLGDPGCGKTTAIETLAFEYADRPERIPVLLHMSEFAAGASLDDVIVRAWGGARQAGHWGAPTLAANLKAYLEAGRLFLLFDALNEMPLEGYRERCAALRRFIDEWSAKGNRFVVTCRSLDYGEELSGLQRVEVQGLNDDQIRRFLQNDLPERWQALWQALQSDDGQHRLLEMARNPYLLTVMIDVFEEDGELSQNRAELIRRFTEIMLEWAKAKCPPDKWLDAGLQFEALSAMAYEMQARSGFGTKVKTEQIKRVMPLRVQVDPNWPAEETPPDQVLGLAATANIVEMPVDRLTVRFYHQLLQEYFAARQMLRQEPEKLAELWRGPWLEAELPAWSRPENNYDPLPPPQPTGWEETTILAVTMAPADDGRFLQALLRTNPVLAGRCLLQAQGECAADLRQAVIAKLLAAVGDPDVALRVRIAAGNLLGFLGDPRSGEMTSIPAGKFLMGEGSEQHENFLPDYRIGKYPVTNAEYRRFIDAGGYRDKSWWTDAGWLEIGQKQTEPRFWRDTRFNKPAQPVIGLSWYECVAYCRWLSSKTGERWRLPTEAEWEKGARGTAGNLFPWGNDFDAGRLNGRGPRGRQVCTSTPVGIYPTGVSPFGLFDCVGNVWEWCATRWKKPFPYDTGHDEWQPDYLQGQNLRVLRGGSWYDTKEATRCTHRFKFQPYGWNDRGGFRLVSPA